MWERMRDIEESGLEELKRERLANSGDGADHDMQWDGSDLEESRDYGEGGIDVNLFGEARNA